MLADGVLTVYEDPTNDKKYLFATMRRGGRFIYAFDITDPENPKYLWRKGCDHAGPRIGPPPYRTPRHTSHSKLWTGNMSFNGLIP
jgi:hypothetical protein